MKRFLALCACLALLGCAPSQGPDGQGATDSDRAQSGERSEAVPTYEEYEAGFEEFEACMDEEGYHLVRTSEADPVIEYAVPARAVDSGVADRCYAEYFEPLDVAWQLAHEDESESADFLRACLEKHGLDPSGSVAELSERIEEAQIDLVACMEGTDTNQPAR